MVCKSQALFWLISLLNHSCLFLQPNYCMRAYSGHNSHVLSLDFHPKKTDLLCSCDANNEIRYWNLSQYNCTRVSKASIKTFFILFHSLWCFTAYSLDFVLNLVISCSREVRHKWGFSRELDNLWLQQQEILFPYSMLRMTDKHIHYRCEKLFFILVQYEYSTYW